jgi:hypothetical protein
MGTIKMKNMIIKNMIIKSLIGITAVLLLSVVAFSQTPKRINFAKSNSLVWNEKVAAGESKDFVFKAKKGQKLSLSFTDETNEGSMDFGRASVEPNGDPLETVITTTKDYTFSVTNNGDKAASFRISISLKNPKRNSK